jgi:8-oxo-dGTP diphosphatase
MGHIHEGIGEHDHTASAFIVRTDTREPSLLLHVHKKLHVLLQPGGHVELRESPWQAIAHEIEEETGYELSQLKILQPRLRLKQLSGAVLHPQPVVHNTHDFDPDGNHKHTDISYAFVTDSVPRHTPGEGESSTLKWTSFEELQALDVPRDIFMNVRQIGEFILTDVLREWEAVDTSVFER